MVLNRRFERLRVLRMIGKTQLRLKKTEIGFDLVMGSSAFASTLLIPKDGSKCRSNSERRL